MAPVEDEAVEVALPTNIIHLLVLVRCRAGSIVHDARHKQRVNVGAMQVVLSG